MDSKKHSSELITTQPKRELSVVLAQRAQSHEGMIPDADTRILSPRLLEAYLQIFRLVHTEGTSLTKVQTLALIPKFLNILTSSGISPAIFSLKISTELSQISDPIDLTKNNAVNDLLTTITQSFEELLDDPTADPNLVEMMQFFLFLLKGGDLIGGNFELDTRLGRVNKEIMYPDRRLKFNMSPYSHAQHIPSLGGTVQAVVPKNVKPAGYKSVHQADSALLEILFFENLERELKERKDRIRVSSIRFTDPIIFIPDFTGKNKREVQKKLANFKSELDLMWGLFAETLYDIIAPINLGIEGHDSVVLNIRSFLTLIGNLHPTSGFNLLRMDIGRKVNSFLANADLGTHMSFQDQQLGFNEKKSTLSGKSFKPRNPSQLLAAFEQMLVKRLNNNFELLRKQVAKVANIAYKEALNSLSKKQTLDIEAKAALKLEITRQYSTWLAMILSQYNRVVLEPALAFQMNDKQLLQNLLHQK